MRNVPTILVLFGVTGNLAKLKILPAIFHLYVKGELPKLFKLVGFSRREWSDEEFQDYVEEVLVNHKDVDKDDLKKHLGKFLKMLHFTGGNFDSVEGFRKLNGELGLVDGKWKTCSNKLFYLSVSPEYYETLFQHLADSGLSIPCSNKDEGWTRIIVEKPFGNDLKTAEKLDLKLGKLFNEDQIYRIDHYLGKDMMQNILNFRFTNSLFQGNWNYKSIESIDVKFLETVGVNDRGAFYDSIGALRDVGQNHLLQMLALVAMCPPKDFSSDSIREGRVKLISNLKTLKSKSEISKNTERDQYDGYRSVKGVAKKSKTETYFKIGTEIKSGCLKGVPITLEAGKKMSKVEKEVVVTFKPSSPCMCLGKDDVRNRIIFRLEPTESIEIEFWIKKPGLKTEIVKQKLEFCHSCQVNEDFADAYERLLLDCFKGDQSLFVSTDEVKAMWNFIDPIICGWKKEDN